MSDKVYGNLAIEYIFQELRAAEKKHPGWPTDLVYASAILNEEAGELTQAVLDYSFKPEHDPELLEKVMREAAQTGAMAMRFLIGAYRQYGALATLPTDSGEIAPDCTANMG